MRLLFVTGCEYLPQRFGGAEVSAHSFAMALSKRGDQVGVLASLRAGDWLWFKNRVASKLRGVDLYTMDQFCGYPVFRGWRGTSGFSAVIDKFKPDIALLQTCPLRNYADLFVSLGLPVVICMRDTKTGGASLIERPPLRYIANSGFLAGWLRTEFGIEAEIIAPLVLPERYRVRSTRESVLFVNPVAEKGVEISLRLAEERPDIPFDFVECWERDSALRHSERVRRAKNIRWHKSRLDVRRFYGRAKLLLMPSQWVETWGRVATEVQLSGIPVLASRIGGLPESVGPGGILVEPTAPLDNWLAALSRMWDDKKEYETLAQEALKYSQRPEIQPDLIVDRLVLLIREHAGRGPRVQAAQDQR
jgi:glycosyltransferase involved in cell wall biosynthesis